MAGGDPDWRDGAAYAALLEAERPLFAWEWCRRDPAYADAARAARGNEYTSSQTVQRSQPAAGRWGLHRFEDPDRAVPTARPMWRATTDSRTLVVTARPAGAPGDVDFETLAELGPLVASDAGEHLLLSDGVRQLRIDIATGSLARGPVRLQVDLDGLDQTAVLLGPLRQLVAAARDRRLAPALHPPLSRAGQRILQLRVFDALRAGASQREIAAALFDAEAAAPRWRDRDSSLRLRVQRLVRQGRALATKGFDPYPPVSPGGR